MEWPDNLCENEGYVKIYTGIDKTNRNVGWEGAWISGRH